MDCPNIRGRSEQVRSITDRFLGVLLEDKKSKTLVSDSKPWKLMSTHVDYENMGDNEVKTPIAEKYIVSQ